MLLIRLSDWLTRSLMVLGAVWAFALCFLILADIVCRAIGTPLSGTKELVANSVVIIVFMQVGYAIRSGSMLRATFVVDMLPPAVQRLLFILCLAAGAGIFFFLLHAGITPALRSLANGEFDGEGALRVPVWPARFAIIIGAGLAGLNYLILLLAEILGFRLANLEL
ncbi:TRAP transporter small permease [Pseudooceanicola algae]|uniref:TRAP transporter small permease protein n=1 Tax=Pseudooceanicola algae TaxID=1537215 RepID=A0A418SHG2_9RHOB|nr:TRAP transporter small permease [Pseudooceanicola algae]QPM90487.1 hypothetical protein PSAL_017260 [Pseudooceanicola algae]